jgi:hypothetical protein
MAIYQNTILAVGPPRYDYGTDGLGHGVAHGGARQVLNNIVCLMSGFPGQTLPPASTDFRGDGNLFWSLSDGPAFRGEWCSKFRATADFRTTGWTKHDQFADPKFLRVTPDFRQPCDLRVQPESPALGAGCRCRQSGPIRCVRTSRMWGRFPPGQRLRGSACRVG